MNFTFGGKKKSITISMAKQVFKGGSVHSQFEQIKLSIMHKHKTTHNASNHMHEVGYNLPALTVSEVQ